MSNVQPISPTAPVPPSPSRVRAYESTRGDGLPKQFTVDGELFSCLPKAPGGIYMDAAYHLERAGGDVNKQGMASLGLMKRFFDGVLLENDAGEDHDESSFVRFDHKVKSKDQIIDIDVLGRIFTDLMEEYAARPTTPPSPSPG